MGCGYLQNGVLVPLGWGCWLLLGWVLCLNMVIQNSQIACASWDPALENACLVSVCPSSQPEENLVVSPLPRAPFPS